MPCGDEKPELEITVDHDANRLTANRVTAKGDVGHITLSDGVTLPVVGWKVGETLYDGPIPVPANKGRPL